MPRYHDPLGPRGLGPGAHVGPPGPMRAWPLWGPWALVGRALVGPLRPCGPGPCGPPWALEGRALVAPLGHCGPLHKGLASVAATIGHSPRDGRRRHCNWMWLWLGQWHDDPRSMSHKGRGTAGEEPATRTHIPTPFKQLQRGTSEVKPNRAFSATIMRNTSLNRSPVAAPSRRHKPFVCMYKISVFLYVYIYIDTHTYIYTYIHIYIYTHVCMYI